MVAGSTIRIGLPCISCCLFLAQSPACTVCIQVTPEQGQRSRLSFGFFPCWVAFKLVCMHSHALIAKSKAVRLLLWWGRPRKLIRLQGSALWRQPCRKRCAHICPEQGHSSCTHTFTRGGGGLDFAACREEHYADLSHWHLLQRCCQTCAFWSSVSAIMLNRYGNCILFPRMERAPPLWGIINSGISQIMVMQLCISAQVCLLLIRLAALGGFYTFYFRIFKWYGI